MVTPNPALLFQFQSLSDQIGGESTGKSLEALDNCKFLDDKYDWLVKFTDIFPLLTAYEWFGIERVNCIFVRPTEETFVLENKWYDISVFIIACRRKLKDLGHTFFSKRTFFHWNFEAEIAQMLIACYWGTFDTWALPRTSHAQNKKTNLKIRFSFSLVYKIRLS